MGLSCVHGFNCESIKRYHLSQEEMQQLFIQVAGIRLVTHRQIQPGFLIDNALMVGKGIEAGLSVIASHAAFADTAKAHLRCGKMNNRVIHAAAAIGQFFVDPFLVCFIAAE